MKNTLGHIVSLELANRSQVQLVGGKAANLGELIRLGLHVPDGFCVTTSAYEHFVARSGISPALAQLSQETHKDPRLVSSWARALILKSQIPHDLRLQIERFCLSLCTEAGSNAGCFAVRSSAVDEDVASESFAGIHESYLNVSGVESVLAKLRDCWASFWSERALIYREIHGLLHRKITGAVIIQRMVQGKAAGVLFTADPASGNRSSLIIEAHQGLGEDVVSGAVTPQRYILSRTPLRITSKYLGCTAASGNSEDGQSTTATLVSHDPVLSDGEILELSQFGIAIEKFYGFPQDVEWIRNDDGCQFLQARPVTTLDTPISDAPDPNVWTRQSINERFPQPLKPLEASFVADCVFTPGFTQLFKGLGFDETNGSEAFRVFAGVPYLNKRLIAQSLRGVPEQAAMQILERSTERPAVPLSLPLLCTGFRLLRMLLFTHRRFQSSVPTFMLSFKDFRHRDFTELTLPQLAMELVAMTKEIKEISRGHMQSVLTAELLFTALKNLGAEISPLLPALTRGNHANKSVEMSARLSELVHLAQACEPVRKMVLLDDPACAFDLLALEPKARPFYCRLQSFLEDFGHRTAMYQLSHPRWIEEPGQVIQLIQNELRMPIGHRHESMNDAELSRLQTIAERQIDRSGFSRFFPWKRFWFRFLLKYAQIYSGVLRENEGFYITMMFTEVKRVLRFIAGELKQHSILADQDDIYYLTFSEICHFADGISDEGTVAEVIGIRKREFLKSRLPETAGPPQDFTGNHASGAPASPGRASGTAVVLSHPADRFAPGSILVTHTLNSAWVSTLRSAAGVVTELGGMLSHGAVLAREFGVPAVLGIGPITRHIHTGQQVTVDGTNGFVYINESAQISCAS